MTVCTIVKRMIYLDYCANMPAEERALAEFVRAERMYPGNANSHHAAGREALAAIAAARSKMASLLGVDSSAIIYTSGATESNNLAITGMAAELRHVGKHIISTALEHSSVSAVLSRLQSEGYEIDLCPIARSGQIDLEELDELLRDDTCLVSVSAVDSELGIVQPLQEIASLVKKHPKTKLHVDVSQAFGRIPVDFSLGDTISMAPHKFGGLNGIGILIRNNNTAIKPLLMGGASVTPYRPGTPTTALLLSTVPAMEDAVQQRAENYEKVTALNHYFRGLLQNIPDVRVNSPLNAIPYILNIGVTGIRGNKMQELLDQQGICVSVKSACASDLLPSKAVYSLYHDKKRSYESFRISLAPQTTKEEIETTAAVIRQIVEKEEHD